MWKLCLAPLFAASAFALRGRVAVDTERLRHQHGWHKHTGLNRTETPECEGANATENATETQNATCAPFPGQQVVMVTVNSDFMHFFENWLQHARPFLTSSEQVVAVAEDEKVVPMLRLFLHESARTPFKIGIPASLDVSNEAVVSSARSHSQDVYEIHTQDIIPFRSKAYKKLVGQRPREIKHFLEQGCSVLYVDIDTAWVKNPFREISRAGNFEMYLTDDSQWPNEEGLKSYNLCSCFLYMHPTSNVKAVMSRWEFLMEGKLQRNQFMFTQAVHEMRKCFPDFAVVLPREEFPPGCDKSSHPTVVHANYMVGEKRKKKFLEKHQAWSLH